jgi:hypothetical protein
VRSFGTARCTRARGRDLGVISCSDAVTLLAATTTTATTIALQALPPPNWYQRTSRIGVE